jgi:putative tryptophan/tyrosine transport system substrate-binding protein
VLLAVLIYNAQKRAAWQFAPKVLPHEQRPSAKRAGDRIGYSAPAREPGNGLISGADSFIVANRPFIISLAERYQIPAIYQFRQFAADGGLMSYGPDTADIFRRSATYVDRILKGANPADLPVQQPTKFEFVINLKTAKALGLVVPPTLLARADEVIE